MSTFSFVLSVMTVAGLLLHLHERVGAQGSSGTLYEGTSASFLPLNPPMTPLVCGLQKHEHIVQGDFSTFILLAVSFFFYKFG